MRLQARNRPPVLIWITNSSVKLEQVIGDVDWANGSNITSQTTTPFNIEETDVSATIMNGTHRIYILGDTIGTNINYDAAVPVAWHQQRRLRQRQILPAAHQPPPDEKITQ